MKLSVCDEFFENDKSIKLGLNGGELQVPCLQIGKEWIYESDEIIERLKIQFQNFFFEDKKGLAANVVNPFLMIGARGF